MNNRAQNFLRCLGDGKSIYDCEFENDLIEELEEVELENKDKYLNSQEEENGKS